MTDKKPYERELHSAEQALLAEKAKVFSAWVDMERIGDELGLPLEGLSPDAIIKEIAHLKSQKETDRTERETNRE